MSKKHYLGFIAVIVSLWVAAGVTNIQAQTQRSQVRKYTSPIPKTNNDNNNTTGSTTIAGRTQRANANITQSQSQSQSQSNDHLKITLNPPAKIEVKEVFETLSSGPKPGIKVTIPDADHETIAQNWKRFLKNYGNKIKDSNSEISLLDAEMLNISQNPIVLISKVENFPGGVLLKVFVEVDGNFVSSKNQKNKFEAIKNLTIDFASSEAVRSISEQLVVEEANLYELDVRRNELKQTQSELERSIKEYEAAIAKAQKMLAENQRQIQEQNLKTKRQIQKVEQLKLNLKEVSSN